MLLGSVRRSRKMASEQQSAKWARSEPGAQFLWVSFIKPRKGDGNVHTAAVYCCGYRSQCPRYRVLRCMCHWQAKFTTAWCKRHVMLRVRSARYLVLPCWMWCGGWKVVRHDQFCSCRSISGRALHQIPLDGNEWSAARLRLFTPEEEPPRFQRIGDWWALWIVLAFWRSEKSPALPKIRHWILLHRPAHCQVTIKITSSRLHFKFEALLLRCFYTVYKQVSACYVRIGSLYITTKLECISPLCRKVKLCGERKSVLGNIRFIYKVHTPTNTLFIKIDSFKIYIKNHFDLPLHVLVYDHHQEAFTRA